MGTYTHLEVAGYPLWETKSHVDPKAMSIFRESDRVLRMRFVSERNSLIWGGSETGKDETETAVLYSCSVTQARDRLSVMGFTLERVRREFESIRRQEIEKYDAWGAESDDGAWDQEIDFLSQLDFETYSDALRRVIAGGLQPLRFGNQADAKHDSVVRYILSDSEEYWLGFLCSDIRPLIRLACELVDPQARVVQDVTDLVEGGYYSRDQEICSEAVWSLSQDHPESSSRIILTEGSTDREFLEESLRQKWPGEIGQPLE
jgi:HEPN/Toprim N-terminal domain 1